jgi:GTP:adenosylcobinamide-phosphate guanylyltransferase
LSAAPASTAGLTALILAGSRGPGDPLAVYAGVEHKALIEIGGRSMLERVIAALAAVEEIGRIVVQIERPDLLDAHPALRAAAGDKTLEVIAAAHSPSSSVLAALERLGTPLLVTTADHALLLPEWVRYFVEHRERGADVCAALAPSEAVLGELPQTRRTWLRFRGRRYSGCNLFYFATPASAGVARIWLEIENQRKRPVKMIRRLGWMTALLYLLDRLSLDGALRRLGRLAGAQLAVVEMPFGLAAVDVDKPADLDLVRQIVAR